MDTAPPGVADRPGPARGGRVDLAAIPFLPLDVAIRLTGGEKAAPIERAFRAWADEGADLERLPGLLESLRIQKGRVAIRPGGSAANALRVARAWGRRVALGGVLGQDSAGDLVHSLDSQAGIDVRLVRRQPGGATPIYLMLVRAGEMRHTALVPRQRRVRSLFQGSRDAWAETAAQLGTLAARCLHLHTGNRTLANLIDELPAETRVSLNLTELPDRPDGVSALEQIMRRAHLVVLSDARLDGWLAHLAPGALPAEWVARCAALLDALFACSPTLELGVVTRAAHGLVARTRNGAPLMMPAYGQPGSARPIWLLDPTGAGDTFTGTLLASLAERDWQVPGSPAGLRTLLARSTIAAALNCERLGATARIPTRAEVDARLERTPS